MIPNNLLPKGTSYFVAGGWAVCPALAGDMDVFVEIAYGEDIVSARETLLKHLKKEFWRFEEQEETCTFEGYGTLATIVKVGKLPSQGMRPEIHVLLTNADVHTTINSFDISTCCVAITDQGYIVWGDHWTSPIEPPIRLIDNPTTDARMVKYQQRFNHPTLEESIWL